MKTQKYLLFQQLKTAVEADDILAATARCIWKADGIAEADARCGVPSLQEIQTFTQPVEPDGRFIVGEDGDRYRIVVSLGREDLQENALLTDEEKATVRETFDLLKSIRRGDVSAEKELSEDILPQVVESICSQDDEEYFLKTLNVLLTDKQKATVRETFDLLKSIRRGDVSAEKELSEDILPPDDENFHLRLSETISPRVIQLIASGQLADNQCVERLFSETVSDRLSAFANEFSTLPVEMFKPIANHLLRVSGEPSAERLEWVHRAWLVALKVEPKLQHPVVPIVRAWIDSHPPFQKIEKRSKQIAPEFLKQSCIIPTGERLPTGLLHTQGEGSTQMHLPAFEDKEADIVVHALPIEIYQSGRGARGAPLDERIFFNAMLARPFGTPEPFNAVRLEPTLRDYVNWLYPNGWNRTNQLPLLQKALYDVHNKRISYERRDWNIIQVLAMPNENAKLDDVLPLIIRYPDGVRGNGPMIDVHRLRRYGLVSASKWRAWIRLHYLWDTAKQRNRGYPIYATIPKVKRNGEGYLLDTRDNLILTGDPYKNKQGRWSVRKGNKPQKDWYHPSAIHIGDDRNPQCDKIPVLTDKHLGALFFDDKKVDNETFWKRVHDAKKAAMDMESEGVIIIERDAIDTKRGIKGWRIIPVFQGQNALPESL